MIDLYTWTTPNGRKPSILLEELGVTYTAHAVDIGAGDQFKPDFLSIAPNNRIPAIVDHDTGQTLMESGAILLDESPEPAEPDVAPVLDAIVPLHLGGGAADDEAEPGPEAEIEAAPGTEPETEGAPEADADAESEGAADAEAAPEPETETPDPEAEDGAADEAE